MSVKNKIKLFIPNILTITRIVLIPFIIGFGMTKHFKLTVILVIIASLTDFLDGNLARLFHTTSALGAKLDSISDKIFAIALSLSIVSSCKNLILVIILEVLIAIMSAYYYKKTGIVKSLMVGKIKTVSLFTTIIIAYLCVIINNSILSTLLLGFIYATCNLQLLSIIFYILFHIENDDNYEIKIGLKDNEELEKTILVEQIGDLKRNYDNDII